jgi:hypothetical protein|tara:strand:- start:1710 stop:2603 length:894 start_codon:yes stop_codon:yes gene_type:complete
MAPLFRQVSRRLVASLSVRRACVAELAAVSNRGVPKNNWHTSPVNKSSSRWSAPGSWLSQSKSQTRGFSASALIHASEQRTSAGIDGSSIPPTTNTTKDTGTKPVSSTADTGDTHGAISTSPSNTSPPKPPSKEPTKGFPLKRTLNPMQDPNVNPLAGMMFPWERAVLSGDRDTKPMSDMTKLYWVLFALAVGFLVANRIRIHFATKQTKDELAAELSANRSAMQRALEGNSFIGETDPFEGMEPDEIEAFLKKQAPDGDPYSGMTPEEINTYLHEQQEGMIKERLSMPKLGKGNAH